jgi:predicted methyltransferase
MELVSRFSRRAWMQGAAALAFCGPVLAGCGRKPARVDDTAQSNAASAAPAAPANPRGGLEWAVAGDWRGTDSRRDAARHPLETLRFLGLKPGMTVIEFWPGAGWYSQILAPVLTVGKGTLIAAGFEPGQGDAATVQVQDAYQKQFSGRRDIYGAVKISSFGMTSGPVAPAGTADMALFMLTLHSWMAAGLAEKAFRDAFQALKPGGVLGVEEHRAPAGGPQDPLAGQGYVQEAFVKQLAMEAGFRFDKSSEINANPKDTHDHPFGVWTLPPERRSAPPGKPADPAFNHAPYDAIGESDRMTLRFVKPA